MQRWCANLCSMVEVWSDIQTRRFEAVAGELRTPIGRVAGLSVPIYVRGGLCGSNLRKWGQFSGTMCLFYADGQMDSWAVGQLGGWAGEADGEMDSWTDGWVCGFWCVRVF